MVFFERLRDEVRDGRSLRAAVERGWQRARRTILVSDTVSFLAALMLWYFSIDDVKGFAFTLGLTTLIDVIVVFLFTKPMVTLLARTKFFGNGHPLSGLDPARLGARTPWRGARRVPARSAAAVPVRTAPMRGRRPGHPEGGVMSRLGNIGGRLYRGEVSIDFVSRRRLWYMISGLILVISIAALLIRGLDYSVEFKGGSIFQFSAPAATATQIDQVVEAAGGGSDAIVQKVGVGSNTSWQVQTEKLPFAGRPRSRTRSRATCTCPPSVTSARPSSGRAGAGRSPRRPWKR